VFSILFVDLDDLKTINDTYGHETGTRAIQVVSKSINDNLRKYDSVYRYGGDEFVVLLPRSETEEACDTAQRIHKLITDTTFNTIPLKIGVSIGIATFDNIMITDRQSLLNAADSALYDAKKRGKNSVCIFGLNTNVNHSDFFDIARSSERLPSENKIIKGLPLVQGIGIGTIFFYHDVLSREIEVREIKPYEIESEMTRVLRAVDKVKNDLELLRSRLEKEIGLYHASIFNVHKMILDDADLLYRIEHELKTSLLNSEHAVRNVFKNLERQFKGSTSTVLRERTFDIHDIGKRILNVMTGTEESILAETKENSIIYTKRLLPSDTIHFTHNKPVAIITEDGGPYSHSALISRAMGIPSISNVHIAEKLLPNGTPAIVNGTTGEIIINPDRNNLKKYSVLIEEDIKSRALIAHSLKKRSSETRDCGITVLANVSTIDDMQAAVESGCDGIGLYRTETAFMLYKKLPSESDLIAHFREVLSMAGGMPVTLRLADIGGDKILPYLNTGSEHNAYLGLRGVRFLLKNDGFLKMQLRVLLQLLKDFRLSLLIPFVNTPDDVHNVRKILNSVLNESPKGAENFQESIPVGAMIETPAAAMRIDEILNVADFVSIGTNDLIQYITAADRESIAVSHYYRNGIELVLRVIKDMLATAKKARKKCILCGEIAGNTEYTKELISMGLKDFSVLPPLIPTVKDKIVEIYCGNHITGKGR
jgi:phosphotransferase system enzyme I (PtsI)